MPNHEADSPITGNEPAINPDHLKKPRLHQSISTLIDSFLTTASNYSPETLEDRRTAIHSLTGLLGINRELDSYLINCFTNLCESEPNIAVVDTYLQTIAEHEGRDEIGNLDYFLDFAPNINEQDQLWYTLFKNAVIRFRPMATLEYLSNYTGDMTTPRMQEVISLTLETHKQCIVEYMNDVDNFEYPTGEIMEIFERVIQQRHLTQFVDVLALITDNVLDSNLRLEAAKIILKSGITE